MFFDPFSDLGQMFVFLPNVVFFGQVHKVDNRFGGEEKERVDYFDLGIRNVLAILWKSIACDGSVKTQTWRRRIRDRILSHDGLCVI